MTLSAQDIPPSVNGTAIIIMSALSFVCGGIFLSVPAIIMANSAKSKIASWEATTGLTHPEAGTVKAGFWVSAVNIGLTVALVALYILIFAVAIVAEAA